MFAGFSWRIKWLTGLSSEQSDFIIHKPTNRQVQRLGVHNIIGKDTVKYTVIDDHDKKVNPLFVTQFTYRR